MIGSIMMSKRHVFWTRGVCISIKTILQAKPRLAWERTRALSAATPQLSKRPPNTQYLLVSQICSGLIGYVPEEELQVRLQHKTSFRMFSQFSCQLLCRLASGVVLPSNWHRLGVDTRNCNRAVRVFLVYATF